MSSVPEMRLRRVNQAPVEPKGGFVLYWMTAARRTERNFGLQRTVEWAVDLKKPIVVLEALRCGYPRASGRLHRFIMDGMLDNMARYRGKPVLYYPYLERAHVNEPSLFVDEQRLGPLMNLRGCLDRPFPGL